MITYYLYRIYTVRKYGTLVILNIKLNVLYDGLCPLKVGLYLLIGIKS